MSIVELYWSGVARRLQEEVDTFNKLIGHAGEQGSENEQSLIRLMERLLPKSLGVGSGVVIDADGNRSKQTDIVIYDAANQPSILAQTSQMLFPVENVFMVFEVKTTLGDEEIEDCAEKKAELQKLVPRGGRPHPAFCVLSYHAEAATANTLVNSLRKTAEEFRPDLLSVIYSAFIAGDSKWISTEVAESFQAGIAALHARNGDDEREFGSWESIAKEEKGSYALRQGIRYPIVRRGRKDAERFIGEPGRALLIYLSTILDILAQRNAIPQPYLHHYLQDVAKELVAV